MSPNNSCDLREEPRKEIERPPSKLLSSVESNAEYESFMEERFNGVFLSKDGKKHLFSVKSLYCMT